MSGKPKGVVHTSAGYMVWASTTFKYVFDYKENDVFWCTADCGWITGHSYLTYGPMINGATQVVSFSCILGLFFLYIRSLLSVYWASFAHDQRCHAGGLGGSA